MRGQINVGHDSQFQNLSQLHIQFWDGSDSDTKTE